MLHITYKSAETYSDFIEEYKAKGIVKLYDSRGVVYDDFEWFKKKF